MPIRARKFIGTIALLALGLVLTTCVAHLHRRATRRGDG